MPDARSSGGYAGVLNRREFVALTGVTGAAAVAGCLSGSDDDGTWFLGTQTDFSANEYHWNLLAGWFIPHDHFGIYAPWTQYLIGEDEFYPHLIQEWEHDEEEGEMILTLSEEFTWGSGDAITAEDLAFQLDVLEAADQAVWQFIDGAEATGEYELTVSYPEGTNPDIVDYAILGGDAAYSPETWEGENWEEDPTGVEVLEPDPSGPLALTDHTGDHSQTEPRDGLDDFADHHLASHYNWDGYRVEHRQDNAAAHQSFIHDEVDGQHSLFASGDVVAEFPEEVREFRIPGGFGMAIWFNHEQEPWDQREVRQALYYSIDRASVITSVGEASKVSHHPAPTGLTWATVEDWLGSTEPEEFTVYEQDLDMAEELLDEAGYDMGDIEVELTFPQGWSDWAEAASTIVDQLEEAGWDASRDPRQDPAEYTDDAPGVFVDQHTEGGAPRMNHPYFSLDYILRNRLRNTESHFANYPTEVEIDGETIDTVAELQTLTQTSDREAQEEIVERLARVVNEDVPCIYVMEKYEQSFVNEARFEIPGDDSEHAKHFESFWPMWWLPRVDEEMDGYDTPGLLKARDD